VQKFGVRNGPVDRRRLSDQDKEAYNSSGAYGERAQAVGRTRAFRGRRAYDAKRPIASTPHTPGSGSLSGDGSGIQQERNRQVGVDKRKSESFRPEMDNDFKKDIYS
jgi:hypothetical protein